MGSITLMTVSDDTESAMDLYEVPRLVDVVVALPVPFDQPASASFPACASVPSSWPFLSLPDART